MSSLMRDSRARSTSGAAGEPTGGVECLGRWIRDRVVGSAKAAASVTPIRERWPLWCPAGAEITAALFSALPPRFAARLFLVARRLGSP